MNKDLLSEDEQRMVTAAIKGLQNKRIWRWWNEVMIESITLEKESSLFCDTVAHYTVNGENVKFYIPHVNFSDTLKKDVAVAHAFTEYTDIDSIHRIIRIFGIKVAYIVFRPLIVNELCWQAMMRGEGVRPTGKQLVRPQGFADFCCDGVHPITFEVGHEYARPLPAPEQYVNFYLETGTDYLRAQE